MNTCLPQLQTFSVHQGYFMDPNIFNKKFPSASIPVTPLFFIAIPIPIYEFLVVPFAREITEHSSGITQLFWLSFQYGILRAGRHVYRCWVDGVLLRGSSDGDVVAVHVVRVVASVVWVLSQQCLCGHHKLGINYFFSEDYDGDQCKAGQHFQINVTHGQGLPKSLQDPSEDAPAPNSPDFAGPDSAPDTIVPSNFNHPIDDETDDHTENSGSNSLFGEFPVKKLANGFAVLLGIFFIF
ncbi:hypothetical protein SLEP1_g59328 [Rubroshorea leprosula]|uniref:Uncharacterized protein n=1 Tax=Rubroshorea leprosula TaxID=152421 RepID=A0AAV5MS11_9ROSI|nr:hypothetical protein SLEP1_g59328 [Rubroshorea leprosula]